jgi:hypothetical protein
LFYRCIGKNHGKKSVKVCHLLIFKFERLLFRLSNAICRNKNPSQTKDQGRSKDKTIIVAALGSMIWPKIKATHHTIIWWWWKLQKFLVVVGKMEHEHWLGMTMNKIKYG